MVSYEQIEQAKDLFLNMISFRVINTLILALFLGVSVSGCSKDKKETEDPFVIELEASPETLSFDYKGGEKSINVTSNYSWRVEFTSPGWCRPDMQLSSGNNVIEITAESNHAIAQRASTIKIVATGGKSVTVNISQGGRPNIGPNPDPASSYYIAPDNSGMRDLTSGNFAKLMVAGWNLGNSLEAISVNNGIFSGGETSWGNPAITKQLIDAVKAAGFNTIRIPVSWSHKLSNPETYEISASWLTRVAEVVGYALDNDMFVMINVHWDGGWLDQPFYNKQDELNTKLSVLWRQIAIRFRNYDDRLMFAGTNEVHITDNYSDPLAENIAVQNSFNQTFVNAVRETGGRNAYRHLIVQAYNTNISYAVNHLVMPIDNISNKLMVEVHFYDPYDFALMESGSFKTEWGAAFAGGNVSNWGQEAWVNSAFGNVKTKFINNGIPIILGEYGAVKRSSLTGDALTRHLAARIYYLEYVTRAAVTNGIVPVYWDNGYYGNNGFALFKRADGSIVDPDALQAIIKGAKE